MGVDSLWASGHVAGPIPMREPLVALARLATLAERTAVGSAIIALPLYQPGLLAKQLAEIDRWVDGRLVFGIGVGGEYPEEFRACEVPVGERGARANEAIPLLRELWSGERVSHAGRFFEIDDVQINPPPIQPGGPPIVVAGRRDPAMKRAAVLGDGWMPYLYSATRYASSVTRITEVAAEAGRALSAFQWMAFVFVAVDDDGDAARADAARAMGRRLRAKGNPDFSTILEGVAVAGNVEEVVSGLQAYVDAGADHLILSPMSSGDRAPVIRRLMEEVVPRLRSPR
ncbi:MAG: LLM class flavin-dependent oxidoreductase [Acidobacteria bacterium]|nr:LLM class flavin-dependent oxidoreductase [Acidobacteriota bacterium]